MNLNMKHIFLSVFIIFVVLTVVIGINHTHEKHQKSSFENTTESYFHGNISLMWTAKGENFFYCNDSILVPEDSMVKFLSMENGTVEKQLTVSEYYFLDHFMFLRINGEHYRVKYPSGELIRLSAPVFEFNGWKIELQNSTAIFLNNLRFSFSETPHILKTDEEFFIFGHTGKNTSKLIILTDRIKVFQINGTISGIVVVNDTVIVSVGDYKRVVRHNKQWKIKEVHYYPTGGYILALKNDSVVWRLTDNRNFYHVGKSGFHGIAVSNGIIYGLTNFDIVEISYNGSILGRIPIWNMSSCLFIESVKGNGNEHFFAFAYKGTNPCIGQENPSTIYGVCVLNYKTKKISCIKLIDEQKALNVQTLKIGVHRNYVVVAYKLEEQNLVSILKVK